MKLRIFAVAIAAVGFAACSSNPDKLPGKNPLKPAEISPREQRALASQLYAAARDSLESADYDTAIQRYTTLTTRFPFTDYAVQGQIEKIYAEYRSYKSDEALTDADHFLRDYPRHASADYVQYLKGLVNFERDRGFEAMLGFDVSKRDITNLRRSFDDFQLLIQKYPNSRYVGDARMRMIDLRNRIADHDMTVVRYYMRRGAYVAAAKRAEQIVAQYPGSPITVEALQALQKAYHNIGLNDQASDAQKLYQAYVDPASVQAMPAATAPVAAPQAVSPPPPPAAAPSQLPSNPLPEPSPDAPQGPTSQTLPAQPQQ